MNIKPNYEQLEQRIKEFEIENLLLKEIKKTSSKGEYNESA